MGVIANLTLDPFLIFGVGPFPALGIRGAAVASIVGYATGFLVSLYLVHRGRADGIVSLDAASFDVSTFRRILGIGAPMAVLNFGRQLAQLLMTLLVFVAGGGAALFAYTIGGRVLSLALVPARALREATESFVGQTHGASRYRRARKATVVAAGLGLVAVSVLGVVQYLQPQPIVRVFAPDVAGRELELAVEYLRILVIGYPAMAAAYVFRAGFTGAGETQISMGSSLLEHWLVRLPMAVAVVFSLGAGPVSVFWTVSISAIVASVVTGGYYLLRIESFWPSSDAVAGDGD